MFRVNQWALPSQPRLLLQTVDFPLLLFNSEIATALFTLRFKTHFLQRLYIVSFFWKLIKNGPSCLKDGSKDPKLSCDTSRCSTRAQKYKLKQTHSPLGAGMLGDHLKLKLNVSFSWRVQSNLRSNCVQVVDALLVHDHHPKVGQVEHQPLLNLNNVTTISDIQAEH